MIVGLALFAFLGSFLPAFLAQEMLAGSVRGLLLASAMQIGLTVMAIWVLLRDTSDIPLRESEASGIGMMLTLVIPGLCLALVLNTAIGSWYLWRIWRDGRK